MNNVQKRTFLAVATLFAANHLMAMEPLEPNKSEKQERKNGCSWGSLITRPRNVVGLAGASLLAYLGYSKQNRDNAITFVNENRRNIIYGGLATIAGYLTWNWYTRPTVEAVPALENMVGTTDGLVQLPSGTTTKKPVANSHNSNNDNQQQMQLPQWAMRLNDFLGALCKGKSMAEYKRYMAYLQHAVKSSPHELLEIQQFMNELTKDQKQTFLAILRIYRYEYTISAFAELVGPKDEWLKAYITTNLQALFENPDLLGRQEVIAKKFTQAQREHYQVNLEIIHHYMGAEAQFMVDNELA